MSITTDREGTRGAHRTEVVALWQFRLRSLISIFFNRLSSSHAVQVNLSFSSKDTIQVEDTLVDLTGLHVQTTEFCWSMGRVL